MSRIIFASRGFTIIEMVLVILIISVLSAIGTVPYNYYMDRVRVEQTTDMIAQKWILAHTDVRNGLLFGDAKNANIVMNFQSGAGRIDIYLLSGTTLPNSLPITTASSNMKLYGTATFPKDILILSMSGVTLASDGKSIGYYIEAPFASGGYFNVITPLSLSKSGLTLTVGYLGGTVSNKRAREIYLSTLAY